MALYEEKNISGYIDKITAGKLIQEIAKAPPSAPRSILHENISLYGAGELGHLGFEYLQELGKKCDSVVDVNAKILRKQDDYWRDKNLKSPEEIPKSTKQKTTLAVSVVKTSFCDLRRKLIEDGWGEVIPFYDLTEIINGIHPMRNGWFADNFLSENISKALYISDRLSDSYSLAHNLSCLAWRILREEWHFDKYPVQLDNRFLIPEVIKNIKPQASFVDVGAHSGLVTKRFLESAVGLIKEVYAIEPDSENYKVLEVNLKALSAKYKIPITFKKIALSDSSNQKNFFSGLGYASQFSNHGLATECSTLDDFDISPTIIKIHVEGAELEVLKGALLTVTRHRPMIMVTTYHNIQGLMDIPFWALENLNEYDFYLRQHSWCATGVVLYCIPIN
jgi:FkbM family methyltransferase